jgi:hypothetical protein
MTSPHAQRGQTLPVWTFGLLTIMMLMFMLLNYAEAIKWQIRAQNAADSVAQATLSVQASNFNEMMITLNAASVEEWRIRKTLNALMEVVQGSGGCSGVWTSGHLGTVYTGANASCVAIYNNLRANYLADLNRYGQDINILASITRMNRNAQISDMNAVFANLTSSCGPTSADCGVGYTMVTSGGNPGNPISRPITNLAGVVNVSGYNQQGGPSNAPTGITQDLTPLQLEIVACANVQPLWAHFFHLNAPAYMALGRAAATTIQVTNEWLAPGEQVNPATAGPGAGQLFQPPEYPDAATGASLTTLPSYVSAACPSGPINPSDAALVAATNNCWDWYGVDYGSNDYSTVLGANPNFFAYANYDEYSPSMGWWAALPMPPFAGTLNTGMLNCSNNNQ